MTALLKAVQCNLHYSTFEAFYDIPAHLPQEQFSNNTICSLSKIFGEIFYRRHRRCSVFSRCQEEASAC